MRDFGKRKCHIKSINKTHRIRSNTGRRSRIIFMLYYLNNSPSLFIKYHIKRQFFPNTYIIKNAEEKTVNILIAVPSDTNVHHLLVMPVGYDRSYRLEYLRNHLKSIPPIHPKCDPPIPTAVHSPVPLQPQNPVDEVTFKRNSYSGTRTVREFTPNGNSQNTTFKIRNDHNHLYKIYSFSPS